MAVKIGLLLLELIWLAGGQPMIRMGYDTGPTMTVRGTSPTLGVVFSEPSVYMGAGLSTGYEPTPVSYGTPFNGYPQYPGASAGLCVGIPSISVGGSLGFGI